MTQTVYGLLQPLHVWYTSRYNVINLVFIVKTSHFTISIGASKTNSIQNYTYLLASVAYTWMWTSLGIASKVTGVKHTYKVHVSKLYIPAKTADWSLATILQPNTSNLGSGQQRVISPCFIGSHALSLCSCEGKTAKVWKSSLTSAMSTYKIYFNLSSLENIFFFFFTYINKWVIMLQIIFIQY